MTRPPIGPTTWLLATAALALVVPPLAAQQRDPFELNTVQQAYLDQVLSAWETESAKINTFSCPFTRWDYALSPAPHIATKVEEGQVSYQQPDKGSFRITKVKIWTPKPIAPGQQPAPGPQGEHKEQLDAAGAPLAGEHWVCDGRSVYEFKHEQKELHVRPIPPELQGKAIVDGPLPFLFGAQAEKLKQRYRMFVQPTNSPEVIQIVAAPRRREDAAEYRGIELQLDKNRMLPTAMLITRPDNSRVAYQFHTAQASINARLGRLWAALFQAPRTPRGWTRVDTPLRQAAAPAGGAAAR